MLVHNQAEFLEAIQKDDPVILADGCSSIISPSGAAIASISMEKSGARISGGFSLVDAEISGGCSLSGAKISGGFSLAGARIFGGFSLVDAEISGGCFLSGARISGGFSLAGARIFGDCFLAGARISQEEAFEYLRRTSGRFDHESIDKDRSEFQRLSELGYRRIEKTATKFIEELVIEYTKI